jgi:hypothetical protein
VLQHWVSAPKKAPSPAGTAGVSERLYSAQPVLSSLAGLVSALCGYPVLKHWAIFSASGYREDVATFVRTCWRWASNPAGEQEIDHRFRRPYRGGNPLLVRFPGVFASLDPRLISRTPPASKVHDML